jgi:o-succinylbenzoate synthase
LPGLSVDARDDYENVLVSVLNDFNSRGFTSASSEDFYTVIPPLFPSLVFGFETALRDLHHGGRRVIFENEFLQGKPIPINGLIWMGDMDFTMDQINLKISEGFTCIKLKVGGLNFDRECDVLSYIRRRYFRENITIRLDANGAFKLDDALYKLEELAKFNVHSIEQPIKPGLHEMEELCRKSPIPVALDEELIGKEGSDQKSTLLDRIKPQFIILKPMLHGGIRGCEDWIRLAEERGIGWWITSSLESSIGLNAICQFTANYNTELPQGLGTGAIYANNFESPLRVEKGQILLDIRSTWDVDLKNL